MSLARDCHHLPTTRVSTTRRRAPIALAIVAAAVALTMSGSTARATVMIELPLERLVRDADVIVRGTVLENGVRLNMRNGSAEPETVTRIRVSEWLAGPGGETVTLRELGGVWQGGGLRFEGTPRYTPGEEIVVFLERRPEAPHDLRTLGMVQGKFAIRHGVPGVPSMVLRDLEGVAFARWAEGRQTVEEAPDQASMELESFLEFIRSRVTPGQGTPVEPEGPLHPHTQGESPLSGAGR